MRETALGEAKEIPKLSILIPLNILTQKNNYNNKKVYENILRLASSFFRGLK